MTDAHRLMSLVTETYGLATRAGWNEQIERAVAELAKRERLAPAEVCYRATYDAGLLHEIAGRLTVGETHFFRHAPHFDALVRFVSERLSRLSSGVLSIWSAGCASGEEPYSAAMAIDTALGEAALSRTRIVATDVNPVALEKARLGLYSAWSFRGTPAWVLGRYFDPCGRTGCKLRAGAVRRAVAFEEEGLLQRAVAFPDRSVDVVFFRNVAIYLQPDALDGLFQQLSRIIGYEGLLVLGPSDPRPPSRLFVAADRTVEDLTVLRPRQAHEPIRPSLEELTFSIPRAPKLPKTRRGGTTPSRRLPRRSPPLPSAPPVRQLAVQPSTRPPAPARTVLAALHSKSISEAADAGDTKRALELACAMVEADPGSPSPYLLRGQLQLATMQVGSALEDLRRAVYLAPDNILARFWYASALQVAGEARRTLAQLSELERRIADASETDLAEDGRTPVRSLLDTVSLMRESLA